MRQITVEVWVRWRLFPVRRVMPTEQAYSSPLARRSCSSSGIATVSTTGWHRAEAFEHGETPDVAAAREAHEELGLDVVIERKVLELHGLHPLGRVQHYFFASTAEREFRGMTGPEIATSSNTYIPRWVDLGELATIDVLPVQLGEFLAAVADAGWPDELTVIVVT